MEGSAVVPGGGPVLEAASALPSAVLASPCAACRTWLAAWPSGRGPAAACAPVDLAGAWPGGNLDVASAQCGSLARAFEAGGGG